jgi:hypothetical protein
MSATIIWLLWFWQQTNQSMVWCQTAVVWFGAKLAVVWFGAKLLLDGLVPNCCCCCRFDNKPTSQWFGAKLLLYGLVPNWLLRVRLAEGFIHCLSAHAH